MKFFIKGGAAVFFSLFIASINAASGSTLFYDSVSGTNSDFYSIDTVTGNDSFLTTVTNKVYYDLASSAIPNTMYAMDGSTNSGCLYTFNVVTFANVLVGCAGVNLHGAAFDSNHGILYSTDNVSLYTVNTSTGAATLIGSIGGLTGIYSSDYDAGTN